MACSRAAGEQPVPAAPSPRSSVPALWVGGILWDHRGSGRFARVRVLFALLGWTCLYLFNKPGDAQKLGELPVVQCLMSPTFQQNPLSLQTLLGPA